MPTHSSKCTASLIAALESSIRNPCPLITQELTVDCSTKFIIVEAVPKEEARRLAEAVVVDSVADKVVEDVTMVAVVETLKEEL